MEPNIIKVLEAALADLTSRKAALDEANHRAAQAAEAYDTAVAAVEQAQEQLAAHMDALMPGGASRSRVRVA